MTALFAGLGLGFAVAADFGPISVLAPRWSTACTRCWPRSASPRSSRRSPRSCRGSGSRRPRRSPVLPPCVALGTLTWFTVLAAGSTVAGRRLGERALRTASVVAGLAVGAFGLVFVVRGAIVLLGA